ncbi:MAG: toll/interleukin-1 receptor domain-containing protein [Rubrivivax sp.]
MDPAAKPTRRARVFISYRRADSAGRAGRLKDDLTRLLGDRVFMDVADIAPGADFETVLRNELASCGAVLAVIGAGWREAFDTPRAGPDYVRLELGQALAQAGVQVIPVLMQGASLPDADRLPDDLRTLCKRQAIAIRDDRWQDDVAHLARALRTTLKLSRLPLRWIVAGALALAAAAAWYVLHRPQPPTAFSRTRAHEVTLAATAKAATACKSAAPPAAACQLVFQFGPSGAARNVYFASGSCVLKAPPFGECVLQRLSEVRIPPFDDADEVEIGMNLAIEADGSPKVAVDE